MADGFDKREKALENKYFRDEDVKFKVISRRRKLMGLWAAEKMHLGEEESLEYALGIVRYGIEHNEEGAVVKKVLDDIQSAGIDVDEKTVRREMDRLNEVAEKQIIEQIEEEAEG